MATDGPATAAELSERTGTQERYCREWLEMQASYATLTTDPDAPPQDRGFTLPPGPAEVRTDEHSLDPLGRDRDCIPPANSYRLRHPRRLQPG